MIKKEFAWNQVYKIVMMVKEDFNITFGNDKKYKDEKDFKTWLELLNNEVWNMWTSCLQFTQYKNFLLIRYGIQDLSVGIWENKNSIYRECRSIVIDLEEDNIALLPFRKFFNLNETEENLLDNV